MKKIVFLVSVVMAIIFVFSLSRVAADCSGETKVVTIESGFKNIEKYDCWPDKITFNNPGDHAVYSLTFGVGSPVRFEETEHVVYVRPGDAARQLVFSLNKRSPLKIEYVKEWRQIYGEKKMIDSAVIFFPLMKEDLPNVKPVDFTLLIKPRGGKKVEFSFRPGILTNK